jgi:hypothetical protein
MAFEIGNLDNPNATKNTVVVTVFEAPGSLHNLHIGLNRYLEDLIFVQKAKWRYVDFLNVGL